MYITRQVRQVASFLCGLVLIGSLVGASLVNAATYYVATTGNDANPGTATKPFRTIKRGVLVLKAGDTLRVKSGTYAEALLNPLPSGLSASEPTTLEGDPASSRPILKPTTAQQGGVLVTSSRNNVRFKNLVFDARSLPAGHSQVLAASGTGITFENFEAIGSPNMWEYGRVMTVSQDAVVTVRNCKMHSGASPKGTVGVHGFYWSGRNGLIENCQIYNNSGLGIQFYKSGCSSCVNNNIFRKNYVHHNGKSGIYMASGYDNQVYNNIIANNGRGVWFTLNRNYLYNNTIFKNSGTGIDITGGSGAIRNNIVYQNGKSIYQSGGSPTLSNNLTSDPKFVNAAGANLHLQSSSPAINKGVTLSTVRTDYDGTSRPQSSTYDIGAYEYTGSTSSTSLASPTNLQIVGAD